MLPRRFRTRQFCALTAAVAFSMLFWAGSPSLILFLFLAVPEGQPRPVLTFTSFKNYCFFFKVPGVAQSSDT
ncbi:hypothetical protein BKA80DRAFT_277506 [Phyllosticta citrichinensis]